MALWDQVREFFALTVMQDPPLQTRQVEGSLVDLIARVNSAAGAQVWRNASIRDALGVPSIHRAVTLIANVTGALSLEAWRQGGKLPDDERPRIIVRPNPFTTPRDFWRDTAYAMATRGEAWWWVAARDIDGVALSVLPVPPAEITVTENPADLRYPRVEWRGKSMPRQDMIQITLLREPGDLRGRGPLQMCDAAVSVSVEAQEWAANYYAEGGRPGTLIKSAVALSPQKDANGLTEADRLRAQWVDRAHNTARVIDPSIEEVTDVEVNVASAAMLEAREYQDVEAARMFGIPATLLDAGVSGQSLTYQNIATEFDKFVRACLWPNYLEPIEQAMSDLLTRATICRFNVDGLLRADIKTRYEVYAIGIDKGVISAQEARVSEGMAPGDIENAPVPLALPQAIPSSLPIQTRSDGPLRCMACGKSRFVVETTEPLRLRCVRCKTLNEAPLETRQEQPPITVNVAPAEVHVAAPIVNISPAQIQVDAPIVNLPEQKPIELKVSMETPEGVERVERMVKESGEATAAVRDMGGRIIDFTASVASLHERVDEVAAESRKPRRYVPERDEEGRIVAVTQR